MEEARVSLDRFESLYAVGGEGAVYSCRDLQDDTAPLRVAKVAVLPHHRPFDLNENEIRKRRYNLRVEAQYLANCGSRFMPKNYGMFEFQNPLLDPERGDAFAELEPVMVMEKLPGRDLDLWLARMHSSKMPQSVMRRTLDRVTVVLLQALVGNQVLMSAYRINKNALAFEKQARQSIQQVRFYRIIVVPVAWQIVIVEAEVHLAA